MRKVKTDVLLVYRPGHGTTDIEKPASVAYNKNVALQTVRWAMVEWMTDEVRQGLWAVRATCLDVQFL